MASQGGDDGERWGTSPATERVVDAHQDDDPVTIRNARPDPLGRTTDKSWSPGGSGPKTRPVDHGTPRAIFDGPTSGGDDADVTQRRYAIRERHGTMPMEQVLVPSEQVPTPIAVEAPPPLTPQVMPPPVPHASPPPMPPAGEVLPNPLQPSHLQSQSVTTLASEKDPPMEGPWTPPPAFSERPPWEEPPAPPPPKSRATVGAAVVIGTLALAGGAFALGWLVKPSSTETTDETDADRAPADSPAADSPADSPAADSPAADSPAADRTPAGSAPADSAPPSSSASSGDPEPPPAPDPSSASSATPAPEREDPPSKAELDELLSYEGYLTVTSTADAEVYVQGKHVGPTNRRLVSKCYQRFVRLKKGTDGDWITPGRPVRIACMSSTTVEINPE